MLPLGHASFAYVCFVGTSLLATRRLPPLGALLPLLVASQLPDLIDKPLVYFGVLPSGRSMGHSLFAFGLFLLVAYAASRWLRDRSTSPGRREFARFLPVAIGVGYLAHLVGDSYDVLLAGRFRAASFLLWPALPAPVYPSDGIPPWIRLLEVYRSPGPPDNLPIVLGAVALFAVVQLGRVWQVRRG